MDKREVLKAIRATDRDMAKTAAKLKRYAAECRTIDRMVQGANGG